MRNQLTVLDSTPVINSDLMKAEGARRKITQSRGVGNPDAGSWISRGICGRRGLKRLYVPQPRYLSVLLARIRGNGRNCRIARTEKGARVRERKILVDANSGRPRSGGIHLPRIANQLSTRQTWADTFPVPHESRYNFDKFSPITRLSENALFSRT